MERGYVDHTSSFYDGGLCGSSIGKSKLFELFIDDTGNGGGYWAYDEGWDKDLHYCERGFTPLRQTIVLFLAAMHGEL